MHLRRVVLSTLHHVVVVGHGRHVGLDVGLVATAQVVQFSGRRVQTRGREDIGRALAVIVSHNRRETIHMRSALPHSYARVKRIVCIIAINLH